MIHQIKRKWASTSLNKQLIVFRERSSNCAKYRNVAQALFRRTIIVMFGDSDQDFSRFSSSLFTKSSILYKESPFLNIYLWLLVINKNRLSFDILFKAVHQLFASKTSTRLLIFCPLLRLMEKQSLCEKCPYLEFFWSVFSRIRTFHAVNAFEEIPTKYVTRKKNK